MMMMTMTTTMMMMMMTTTMMMMMMMMIPDNSDAERVREDDVRVGDEHRVGGEDRRVHRLSSRGSFGSIVRPPVILYTPVAPLHTYGTFTNLCHLCTPV